MVFEHMSIEVKKKLLRMMHLMSEIDNLIDNHPTPELRPERVTNTIDVLQGIIETIRTDLKNDKK